MHFAIEFAVIVVSGAYTSLWGAFKDGPYEGFKPKTFPRSVYFHIAIFLPLYFLPIFSAHVGHLGLIQLFFLVMGIERFPAEIYRLLPHRRSVPAYFVPSRITFFGRYVESSPALRRRHRHCGDRLCVSACRSAHYRLLVVLAVAYATGCIVVASAEPISDAPFEGFKPLKFQRSGTVLAVLSPIFYSLYADPENPLPLGFLIYMNGGLERFSVEYYKTYIQRNMSGKFRPDLPRIQEQLDTRERFHYAALAIIAALALLYAHELGVL